ncbi:MAG: phosphoribosylformylglycinamidine synthase subunit PurQ [Nanoarchaeota archaeon]|nr:phosphoribosylformylglycinamidine synthase subunit PurQ [Nanoarchaeota archaeon]
MKPKVCVLAGYGINCDDGTKFAFDEAGADAKIVHINDLIEGHEDLSGFQILAFPGGFSMGDDTGAGKAYANKVRNNLWDEVRRFAEEDNLMIGICNGFQIMTLLGLLPAFDGYGACEVALTYNLNNKKPQANARYDDRWVTLMGETDKCVWTRGIDNIRVPIAHGEGRFYAPQDVLTRLNRQQQVVFRYAIEGGILPANLESPYNPNGSLEDIAAICDHSGRILGMMPHPERAIRFTQGENWTLEKEALRRQGKPLPKEREGIRLFRNAVHYFS